MNTFDSEYPFSYFSEDSNLEEIIEYIQSHFQKNNAFNTMSEGKIPMYALVFYHVGETKSLHTIISYILTSLSNGMICENIIDHWFLRISNKNNGGVPTTINDIKT